MWHLNGCHEYIKWMKKAGNGITVSPPSNKWIWIIGNPLSVTSRETKIVQDTLYIVGKGQV